MPDLDQIQKLWQMATEQIKKRTNSIPFWQAMESIVVLDYEEGPPHTLVLGLPGETYSRAGHLEVPENRNLINQVLLEITRESIAFRIVECGSRADWEHFRGQEERKRAASMALASGQRIRPDKKPAAASPGGTTAPAQAASPEDAVTSIDDILDRAYKMFAAMPHRTLRQSRARFVRDAAQMLAGAEGQLASSGMAPDAVARIIDRAIDRIAVWGECEGTTVALEYVRFRDRT